MKNDKTRAAKKNEKIIKDAAQFIGNKKKELQIAMTSRRKGWVEKSQTALAAIEQAVADLSRKIEVYKKQPILDEKRRKQALMTLGAAAAITAGIIGGNKIRQKIRNSREE